MKLPTAGVDRTLIKSLIDQWLMAEIDEDTYLREAPEGETHDGVILDRRPTGEADAVRRILDPTEFAALERSSDNKRATLIGPKGYLLEEVTDLDLARSAQRKTLEGADGRLAEDDEHVAMTLVRAVFARHGLEVNEFSPEFEFATKLMVRAQADLLHVVKSRTQPAGGPSSTMTLLVRW